MLNISIEKAEQNLQTDSILKKIGNFLLQSARSKVILWQLY